MSNATVGHNVDGLQEWTENLDVKNMNYQEIVDEMYDIFAGFYNSPEFKGNLSNILDDVGEESRGKFKGFSEDFEEASKVVRAKRDHIVSEEERLANNAQQNNPMVW